MVQRTGQILGHYRLTRFLGSGGFAEVYLGEHLYLKRQVLWVYQFNDAQKRQMAQAIAGKSESNARTLLLSQKGVKDVTISVQGSNNAPATLLPTNANSIGITINTVSGMQNPGATPTPAIGNG